MKRVLLKLSGEALAGDKHTGFDEPTVTEVAKQVKQIVDGGTEVGIVTIIRTRTRIHGLCSRCRLTGIWYRHCFLQ